MAVLPRRPARLCGPGGAPDHRFCQHGVSLAPPGNVFLFLYSYLSICVEASGELDLFLFQFPARLLPFATRSLPPTREKKGRPPLCGAC